MFNSLNIKSFYLIQKYNDILSDRQICDKPFSVIITQKKRMNHRVVYLSVFLCNRLQLLCTTCQEDRCTFLSHIYVCKSKNKAHVWKHFPETRSLEHSWDYFILLSPLSAENFLKTVMFAYYYAGMDFNAILVLPYRLRGFQIIFDFLHNYVEYLLIHSNYI